MAADDLLPLYEKSTGEKKKEREEGSPDKVVLSWHHFLFKKKRGHYLPAYKAISSKWGKGGKEKNEWAACASLEVMSWKGRKRLHIPFAEDGDRYLVCPNEGEKGKVQRTSTSPEWKRAARARPLEENARQTPSPGKTARCPNRKGEGRPLEGGLNSVRRKGIQSI